VGDVSLTAAVLEGSGVPEASRAPLGAALAARNVVEWRRLARAAAPDAALLAELPSLRGGRELVERIAREVPAAAGAAGRLGATLDLLDRHGVGDAVVLDLGVLREWHYYSGIVFEAYAPGVGAPIAQGGRYDGLGGRFGRGRPAVGFGITLDLLHQALLAAGNGAAPARDGVVLVGALDDDPAAGEAVRAAGVPVVALAASAGDPEGLAAADGWRWVARRAPDGYTVLDRVAGTSRTLARLEEVLTPS
jgi:ATP phosphoribosyltransferase regulatory subunit